MSSVSGPLKSEGDFRSFAIRQLDLVPLENGGDLETLKVALRALNKNKEILIDDLSIRRSVNGIRDAIEHPEAFVDEESRDKFVQTIKDRVKSTLNKIEGFTEEQKQDFVASHKKKAVEETYQIERPDVVEALIAEFLDKIPIRAVNDIDKVKTALLHFERKGEIVTSDKDLQERLQDIKDIMEDPLAWGYVNNNSEAEDFVKIFLKGIHDRIEEFNGLDETGKADLLKEKAEVKLKSDEYQSLVADKIAPFEGSKAHVLSEDEWLDEEQERQIITSRSETDEDYTSTTSIWRMVNDMNEAANALKQAGVSENVIELFLGHPDYSGQYIRELVNNPDQLGRIKNTIEFLAMNSPTILIPDGLSKEFKEKLEAVDPLTIDSLINLMLELHITFQEVGQKSQEFLRLMLLFPEQFIKLKNAGADLIEFETKLALEVQRKIIDNIDEVCELVKNGFPINYFDGYDFQKYHP